VQLVEGGRTFNNDAETVAGSEEGRPAWLEHPPVLRVQLLGSGRIFANDAEIKLRSRVWTLPLLGYLLLHRGEVVPRRRLAFTLWPDETEDDALERLRHNLYRLMKALPSAADDAPWLSVAGHTIGWNASAPCACDVVEFERLRADEATLERAVAAYGGDLLAEFDADWIAVERERLRRLYHADLHALIRSMRSRRALEPATRYAQLLLASDPWNEECLRALISVRYESGDASGALAAYDAFARRLRADMNADPMPETLALREAIARGATIASTLGTGESAPARPAERTPFVGRADELAKLREWWLRAARGSGRLGFVRGEAGIGKSRIVSELALGVEGGRVLVGTTSSPERDTYESLASALREALPLVAGVALAPPFLAAIAELVPELRSYRADIPQVVRLDPANERARLLDSLAQLFAALARPRPLLVILDDLHRAGNATIEALASIVPRLAGSPILFVATCRPETVDRSHPLRRLISDSTVTSGLVELGPLAEQDVRSLAGAIDGEQRTSPDVFARLVARSAGNPLFITELMRHALRAQDADVTLPDSVRALIAERVASVAATSRAVAEIAAVAGEAFTVETVQDLARLSYGEVLDGLDELLDRHLVRESTGHARYEYAFSHHLIHAAIYDGVPADARRRRHRRFARLLDATAGSGGATAVDERAREIAFHYERGGEAARAAQYYAIAARRAAALYANEEARELLDLARKLDAQDDRRQFELLLLRSRLNARLGDASADRDDVRVLEELAERLDPDAKGDALLRRIDLAVRQGDRERECAGIERLRVLANATLSDRWVAATDEAQAKLHLRDGEMLRAIERAMGSRERYERLDDDAACARVTALAARAAIYDYAQAANSERLASEALRFAEAAGDPEARIAAFSQAARVATLIDDRRAVELAQAALAISLEIGDRAAEVRCRESLGVVYADQSQIEAAATQLREALRLCESLGLTERLPEVLSNLGFALCEADIEASLRLTQRAVGEEIKRGTQPDTVTLTNLAGYAWALGDLPTVAAALEQCRPIIDSQAENGYKKAIFLQMNARLLRCRRRFDDSIMELQKLLANLEHDQPRTSNVDKMIAEVYEDLAVTQFCSGRFIAARQSLETSAEVANRIEKERQTPLRRHWIEACLCRAEGRPDEARLALGRASEIYRAQLGRLTDPDLRAPFAEMPLNRAVRVALERDEWPAPDSPCIVAFPGPAGSPGSPLLEPGRVGVGAAVHC
jgi:DNA-binding SARP family transcriptional activator